MIKINNEIVKAFSFPDGTSQFGMGENLSIYEKIVIKGVKDFHIEYTYSNESEIMMLFQILDLLNCFHRKNRINLKINYLPYARQDKELKNCYGLFTFAKLLNTYKLNNICIVDPHSEEAIKAISNSICWYPISEVEIFFKAHKCDLICYPDEGASKKYKKIYDYPSVNLIKYRKSDGEVSCNLEQSKIDLRDKKILIVDDICDGGATFISACELLKRHKAKEVHLFTTYGIYSKGIENLTGNGLDTVNCYMRIGNFI